ncbi:MAG: right-handed parallel beta-helix repeat-containing protein [Casimicrobiaceae bacterium]
MSIRIENVLQYFVLLGATAAAAVAGPALAVQRTFVASTGVDTNPCTLTSPCRGFAAAVGAVATNGEVVILDSAGYGPVTINQPVTITAPKGVYAGVTVTTGTGIAVAAGGGRVTLRGLTINGQGGNIGIDVQSVAVLELYDVDISGLPTGLQAAGGTITAAGLMVRESLSQGIHLTSGARMHMQNSRVENNLQGVVAQDGSWFNAVDSVFVGNYYGAIDISAGAGQTAVINLEHCYIADNGHSFAAIKTNALDPTARVDGTLTRNIITANSGYGVIVGNPYGSEGSHTINIVDNTITNNAAIGILIQVPQFDTTKAKIVLSGNTISRNDWGVGCNGAGVVTRGNNTVRDNVSNQLTCAAIVNETGQ